MTKFQSPNISGTLPSSNAYHKVLQNFYLPIFLGDRIFVLLFQNVLEIFYLRGIYGMREHGPNIWSCFLDLLSGQMGVLRYLCTEA